MKMAIMCGLPRSGKSTCAKSLAPHHVRVCPDDIRLALHGSAFIATAEPFVWAIAETMAHALLIGGQSVVIDATNTTHKSRAQWVRLAKSLGLTLDIYYMASASLQLCLDRNVSSPHVPAEVIERMAKQLELPSTEEGGLIVI